MLQLALLAACGRIFHRKVFGTPFVAARGASSGRGTGMAQWYDNRQRQCYDGHSFFHLTLHCKSLLPFEQRAAQTGARSVRPPARPWGVNTRLPGAGLNAAMAGLAIATVDVSPSFRFRMQTDGRQNNFSPKSPSQERPTGSRRQPRAERQQKDGRQK